MQFLGNIDNKKKAFAEAEKLAKKLNKVVVIEKAKRKDGVHKYTTYRGWLKTDSFGAEVLTMEEFKNCDWSGEKANNLYEELV